MLFRSEGDPEFNPRFNAKALNREEPGEIFTTTIAAAYLVFGRNEVTLVSQTRNGSGHPGTVQESPVPLQTVH